MSSCTMCELIVVETEIVAEWAWPIRRKMMANRKALLQDKRMM